MPTRSMFKQMDALLSGITPENVHDKVDFGKPVGKELI